MARSSVILPQADAACGKLFFGDRRTADGHRIALEVWNRATGPVREGYRLSVVRCRRCGGFHVGHRSIDKKPMHTGLPLELEAGLDPWERHEPATSLGAVDPFVAW